MSETTNPVHLVTSFDAVHLDEALGKVEKYNRRAARAGVPADALFSVVHSTTFVPDADAGLDALGLPEGGTDIVTFVVLGAPLVIAGWTFVATLSFDREAGVITRPVPDAPVVDLSQYRTLTVPLCDQCKTRRQRKDVYVLLSEQGELKVVGRNCLAAFIGLDVEGALRFLGDSGTRSLEEGLGFAGEEWRFPATTVLAVASAAIAAFGWVAKSSYSGVPTAARVEQVLYPLPTAKGPRAEALATREAVAAKLDEAGGPSRALERAEEVLAWVRGGDVGTSEYAQNLQAILGAETVSGRNLGLAVSAVSSWAKAQDRVIERQERAARAAASDWVGTPGSKLELAVELVQQPRFIDGDYGVSTLLVFADETGNVFKWFASGSKDWKVGTRFTGKATVKKHEDYNGTKSTVVTRAKLEEV